MTRLRARSFLALGLLVAAAATAAPAPAPPTLPVDEQQRIDALFAPYTRPGAPGCAVALLDHGRIAYQKGYGLANIEHGVPIDPLTTVFDTGSTGKQFTAASILLLAQDGKLSLDDDIRRYVPELPDYGHRVTLDHLLRHTSGIPDYIALMFMSGFKEEDHTTDTDALRAIARVPQLGFVPGDEHSYSNSGYFLLSLVVKRASGQSLRAFAQQRIFAPLGMAHTRYLDDHTAVIAHKASSYYRGEGDGYALAPANWEQTGDGAVQTTVGDLAKWDRNFYTGQVGGRALVDQLQANGVLNNGESIRYARGLVVEPYRGLTRVHHGGAWAGFRSQLARFPGQQVSVMTLCNIGDADSDGLTTKVADIHLAAALAPAPGATPRANVTAPAGTAVPPLLAGLYANPAKGLVLRLAADAGQLWQVSPRGSRTALVPTGGGRFDLRGTAVAFPEGADGTPSHLTVEVGGKPERLERQVPASPTPAALAAYTGRFHSRELDVPWTLLVHDGRLTLRPPRGADVPLEPTFADAFRGAGGLMLFQRDAQQRVTGFQLAMPRVRGLRFVRQAPEAVGR